MRMAYGFCIVIGATGIAAVAALSQLGCRSSGSTVSTASMESLVGLEGHELFASHCAPCHGATGGGKGPAAIGLTVAPRDFFHERFRYVSTSNGVPSEEDLVQSIRYGRRFGEMPANPQLSDAELHTLALYILEIQRLGWYEVLKVEFADDDDTSPEELEDISHIRVRARKPIHVTRPTGDFRRDLDIGRGLYGENCASCHGTTGRGDGLAKPLDEQGKPITVRDLTSGMFRGGTTVDEVFKRIRCGIPGTPMSAAAGLTDDQIWQLVYYVRYLAGRK